jgi:hypothetical protein
MYMYLTLSLSTISYEIQTIKNVIHVHVSHSFTVHHQLWDTDDKKCNTCTCISYMYYIFYRLYLIADGGQWKSEIHVHVSHFLSSVSHSWWWTVKEWDTCTCITFFIVCISELMVDRERVRYMYMYYIFYRLYLIADHRWTVKEWDTCTCITFFNQLWDTDDKKCDTCTCISLFHCPPVIIYEIQTIKNLIHVHVSHSFTVHLWSERRYRK